MKDSTLLNRLFSQKIQPPLPGARGAEGPLTNSALFVRIRHAGFPVPFEGIESFWLPYLASLVLRKGPKASQKELTALMAILEHLGPKEGLELSCEVAQVMKELESP